MLSKQISVAMEVRTLIQESQCCSDLTQVKKDPFQQQYWKEMCFWVWTTCPVYHHEVLFWSKTHTQSLSQAAIQISRTSYQLFKRSIQLFLKRQLLLCRSSICCRCQLRISSHAKVILQSSVTISKTKMTKTLTTEIATTILANTTTKARDFSSTNLTRCEAQKLPKIADSSHRQY